MSESVSESILSYRSFRSLVLSDEAILIDALPKVVQFLESNVSDREFIDSLILDETIVIGALLNLSLSVKDKLNLVAAISHIILSVISMGGTLGVQREFSERKEKPADEAAGVIHTVYSNRAHPIAAFDTKEQALDFMARNKEKADAGDVFEYRTRIGKWEVGFPGDGWD